MDLDDISSLLAGENAAFLDDWYLRWRADPASVPARWAALFQALDADAGPDPSGARYTPPGPDARSVFNPGGGACAPEAALEVAHRQAGVAQFINAWRVRGHFTADLDPLGRHARRDHPELTLAWYGLGDADLDAVVPTTPLRGLGPTATVRAIRDHLRAAYGGSIGAEFMNIDDLTQKRWVIEQLEELPARKPMGKEAQRRFLRKLSDAENFERMLHHRFPGTKRFSLEGGETLIPLLNLCISEAARHGVREVLMGMAHRGRLNVLANTLEKPSRLIIGEFEDTHGRTQGSGDVKYHLGYSSDVRVVGEREVHLSLTPNPSHLEVVNPVVEGRTRAKQDRVGNTARDQAMAVLLHGDAAFIGQGSVAEVLQLSELDGYRSGGTIHVVVNNQIGFTTAPRESRSTPYATDVARMLAVPIFHVNGEDPQAVAAVVEMAVAWRQRFHRDVVIDMYCYRKHGHNEGDEPSFTQPLMYDEIRRRPVPREVCAQRLVAGGDVTADEVEAILQESRRHFDAETVPLDVELPVALPALDDGDKPADDADLELYRGDVPASLHNAATHVSVSALKGRWIALTDGRIDEEVDTAYDLDLLRPLLLRACTAPEGFQVHTKIKRLLQQRQEMARGEREVDWAMAELAAFATLVADDMRVRLSGQDSGRGTFSQRHAVWTDITTGDEYFPLSHLTPDQAPFQVIDSNLSELAVLGFEYGYSLDMPNALVLWEAQFGDFANGAQVIIDQYLASSEQKWGRMSGLVLLLPHGYEGQGPEHSSARLERWLQLCAEDNMQVANCSTPANYFHILRRQVIRHVRKPLVLLTPKSLLRNAACTSPLSDLAEGRFQPVIVDPRRPATPRRIVLCSGHVYYDLVEAMPQHADAEHIAVHRVELLYPLPVGELLPLLAAAPDAEIVWCQEEPKNMGAWPVLSHWLAEALHAAGDPRQVRYVGRAAAASPATGSYRKHTAQQAELVRAALTL